MSDKPIVAPKAPVVVRPIVCARKDVKSIIELQQWIKARCPEAVSAPILVVRRG